MCFRIYNKSIIKDTASGLLNVWAVTNHVAKTSKENAFYNILQRARVNWFGVSVLRQEIYTNT